MKKIFLAVWMLLALLPVQAQEKSMADVFRTMPDSVLAYLTTNNRLDLVDFLEANMKAEVTNRFDGKTEMTVLTADSLSLQLNSVVRVDMKLVPVAQPVDSSMQVVRLARTYRIKEGQEERVVDVYSSAWRRLSSVVECSSLLAPDDEIFAHPQR